MKDLDFPPFFSHLSFFLLLGVLLAAPLAVRAQDTKAEAPVKIRPADISVAIAADDEADGEKSKGTTVRGRVVYADTGRPVRRAEISLAVMRNGYNDGYSRKVITNANGDFEITGVRAGTYLPYIKIPGVFNENSFSLTTRMVGYENKEPPPHPDQIVVPGVGEINVLIEAKRGGSITGKILYFDGEPAVGMKVEVLKKGRYGYDKGARADSNSRILDVGAVTTDDLGVYRFSGLPEGNYLVRVVETVEHSPSPGQDYYYPSGGRDSELKTYYPNTTEARDAKPVELTLGQEQAGIDLIIPDRKFFSIKGIVVAKSDKKRLKNFTVSFSKVHEDDGTLGDFEQNSQDTDATGEWGFVDLPRGKYIVTVKQGYTYEITEEYDANGTVKNKKELKYASVSKEIAIEDNDIKDFVFEMPLEAVISGTVVMDKGKSLPAQINLFAFDPKNRAFSANDYITTQADPPNNVPATKTTFTLKGLSNGTFNLITMSGEAYIKEIKVDGAAVTDNKIEVKEAQQITGVQIVLSGDMGTIKGKINNFDKNFLTIVIAFPVGGSWGDSYANVRQEPAKPDGTFELKVPPGEYSVVVVNEKIKFDPKVETREKFFERLSKNPARASVKMNETSEIAVDLADQ